MMSKRTLSAAQTILLAAARLSGSSRAEFSEWDLTVAAWQCDKNRFGCRGYEMNYPDHKRVMMEIMGLSKKENPIRKGWMERTRPNHYRLTSLGLAAASTLDDNPAQAAPALSNLHDALTPYIDSKVFQAFRHRKELPKMWLSVEAFYGITSTTASEVRGRIEKLESTIKSAKRIMTNERAVLTRGPVGSGKQISPEDVETLEGLHGALLTAFSRQFDSLLRK